MSPEPPTAALSTIPRRTLAAIAIVAVLVTSGCSKDDAPDFPTTGTLTADDLGAGDWTGPYETWSDTSDASGGSSCPRSLKLWFSTPQFEDRGTAVWQNGEALVWSLAFRYATPGGAEQQMDSIREMQECVDHAAKPNSDWTFTFDDDGTTVTTHETNAIDGGTEVESASTSSGDTVASVIVSYPSGEPPAASAEDLLDKAVTKSAALSDES